MKYPSLTNIKLTEKGIGAVLFLFLSIPFIMSLRCLADGTSIFSLKVFLDHWKTLLILLFFFLPALASTLKASPLSKYLDWVFFVVCLFLLGFLLSQRFDKLVLYLGFAWMILGQYLLSSWALELKEPWYDPRFAKEDIEKPGRFPYPVTLVAGDVTTKARLVNWGPQGFFVFCENNPCAAISKISLQISIEGRNFVIPCDVISRWRGRGVGLRVCRQAGFAKAGFGAEDFWKVLEDRGFVPQFFV